MGRINYKTVFGFTCICTLAALLTGCMDITGRGPAPLKQTMTTADVHPREGHVYCMRGWLGIFSTGMDALAEEINKEVAAASVADEEWRRLKGFLINEKKAGQLNEPLVLVGHSYGADDQIRVAQELNDAGITVDLLLVVDPVTPSAIPDNVKRVYCIYKSHPDTDAVPAWRGVPIDPKTAKCPVTNINLRDGNVGFDTTDIGHINIEKSEGVHKMVMAEIRKVCPLRDPGVARDATPPFPPTVAAPATISPAPAPAPVMPAKQVTPPAPANTGTLAPTSGTDGIALVHTAPARTTNTGKVPSAAIVPIDAGHIPPPHNE